MKTRHKMDRLIVGNQVYIMRALAALAGPGTMVGHAMDMRIRNIKDHWRQEFKEEVGFDTYFGDELPKEKS